MTTIITILAALCLTVLLCDLARDAMDQRRHPRQGDDQAMYH